jgi:Siphovirus ReqiPepy6 Gp37-like protein
MNQYRIQIRDKNLTRQGEFASDDFSSLELLLRFNDVSAWKLTCPYDNEKAQLLKNLRADPTNRGRAGIIVYRNDTVLLSGPVEDIEYSWDQKKGSVLVMNGLSDERFIRDRLALPQPWDAPYNATAYDTQSGPAETVMHAFIRNNIGSSAKPSRKAVSLVQATNLGRGKNVKFSARFNNLLELLKKIALAGASGQTYSSLGFRIVQNASDQLEFQVYIPQDRTASAIFSPELGNLLSFTYKQEAPQVNYVIGGGGGSGTARTFAWSGDEPSRDLYGTREEFIDQRQTTDTNEITDAIYARLEEGTERTELSISPIDTEGVQYGTHYQTGDKVTVRIGDEDIKDVVREVSITLSGDGEKIIPTIGTNGVGTTFRLLDNVRNLEARVGNLERRQ